jgi:hypothetical protein
VYLVGFDFIIEINFQTGEVYRTEDPGTGPGEKYNRTSFYFVCTDCHPSEPVFMKSVRTEDDKIRFYLIEDLSLEKVKVY